MRAPRASALSATTLPSAPEAPVMTITFPSMMEPRAGSLLDKICRSSVSEFQTGPAIRPTTGRPMQGLEYIMRHLPDHGLPLVQLKEQRRDLIVALQNRRGPVSGWELMQIAAVQQAISAFEEVITDLDAELEAAA